MNILLKVLGVRRIDKALADLEPKIQKKILRDGLKAGAKIVADEAKLKVPVDSGDLKKSIKVRAGKRAGRGKIRRTVVTGKGFFKGQEFYGGFVEFGTRKMRARPFMRPAYEAKKKQAKNASIDEINRLVQQAVKESKT